jgi:hypothetical protein
LLKLEAKATLEAAEAAALWLGDTDDVGFKIALASFCGTCARQYRLIASRLAALGVAADEFDPVAVGYSKLFAFERSLQTVEERAAAGALTIAAYSLHRHRMIAARATLAGDRETAELLSDILPAALHEHLHEARLALLAQTRNEEGQTRARRASFRAIELLGELQDPTLVKKFLTRSRKKSLAPA